MSSNVTPTNQRNGRLAQQQSRKDGLLTNKALAYLSSKKANILKSYEDQLNSTTKFLNSSHSKNVMKREGSGKDQLPV